MLLMFCLFVMSYAAFAEVESEKKNIGVTITSKFATEYRSDGKDKYDGGGLFAPGVSIDLGKGFAFELIGYYPTNSGHEMGKRYGYGLSYKTKIFEEETYQTNVKFKQQAYDYLKGNRYRNYQKSCATFSFPNLVKIENGDKLIPNYSFVMYWNYKGHAYKGTMHGFGTEYHKNINNKKYKFYCKAYYSDTIGNSKSGFSYSDVGVLTDFAISKNMTLIPFLVYQITFDDEITSDGGLYGGLAIKIKF